MKRFWFALGVVLFVAALARPSHAHDPFELTAIARVRSERLVVEVTMARSTAHRLVTGDRSARATFPLEAFAAYRSKLEALAPSLYEVTSDERRLAFRAASPRLTDEGDVELVVISTSPPGARLVFRASHLDALGEGYTSALSLALEGAKPTTFGLLTAADPLLEYRGEGTQGHFLADYAPLFALLGVLVAGRIVERSTRRASEKRIWGTDRHVPDA